MIERGMKYGIQIQKKHQPWRRNKSASVSFGTKGVRKTISTSGRETTTFSIPGTGVSYVDSKKSSLFGGLFGGSSKKTAAKKTKKK